MLENAIKHGLPEKGEDGKLTIGFQVDQNKLVCTIADNGIGRPAAIEKAKGKSKSHESAAIQGHIGPNKNAQQNLMKATALKSMIWTMEHRSNCH